LKDRRVDGALFEVMICNDLEVEAHLLSFSAPRVHGLLQCWTRETTTSASTHRSTITNPSYRRWMFPACITVCVSMARVLTPETGQASRDLLL